MAAKRLITIALTGALAVLGTALVLGARPADRSVQHLCTPTDKAFLSTASTNMAQLAFLSDQLSHGAATREGVSKAALVEARQIAATRPLDPTLNGVRMLLNGLLEEYGLALRAEVNGHSGKLHMKRSWRLAGEIHDQLNGSNAQLAQLGCDATPLLSS